MKLSWLEISFLYLATLSIGANILQLGFIYHDIDAFGMGVLIEVYCLVRGLKALEIWWKSPDHRKRKGPVRED